MKDVRWPGLEAEFFHARDYCGVDFSRPLRTLSSAVLSGGLSEVRYVLNLRVAANPEALGRDPHREWPAPAESLARFARGLGWAESVAGMMTSADMKSHRISVREEGWGGVFCFLTAGLTNSLAAGDPGAFAPEVSAESLPAGTINIVAGTSLRLTDAALAEALMIVTESKAAVLGEFNIISPLSGRPATGTGTDSVLIASGEGSETSFCGKHTRLGQLLGETVREALASSVEELLTLPDFDRRLLGEPGR